jgi:hypothetical protein
MKLKTLKPKDFTTRFRPNQSRTRNCFYTNLSSVLGKFSTGTVRDFAGTPEYINQDVKNILAVTTQDVMQVYETTKGKNM